jgi:hypothetical protein
LSEVKTGSLFIETLIVKGTGVFAPGLSHQVKTFFPGGFKYGISLYDAESGVFHHHGTVINTTLTATKTYHLHRSF